VNYAVVSPVRNEADNLPRLIESIRAQTVQPVRWIIVDTGSDDRTVQLAGATELPYAALVLSEGQRYSAVDRSSARSIRG
jgi:GT2 family glycosyltransferase